LGGADGHTQVEAPAEKLFDPDKIGQCRGLGDHQKGVSAIPCLELDWG
jgi:hypothetical protein